jgi:hypothetical protein
MFESDWRELCTKSVRFCTLLVALPIPRVNSWFVVYYRPIFLITLLKAGGEKGYSLSVGFFCFRRKELRFRLRS